MEWKEKWSRKTKGCCSQKLCQQKEPGTSPVCSVKVSLIPALARVSSEPVWVVAAFAINANISENTNPCFTQTLRPWWILSIGSVSHRDVPNASAKWASGQSCMSGSAPHLLWDAPSHPCLPPHGNPFGLWSGTLARDFEDGSSHHRESKLGPSLCAP